MEMVSVHVSVKIRSFSIFRAMRIPYDSVWTFLAATTTLGVSGLLICCKGPASSSNDDYGTWEVAGGSAASIRYSSLEQVDTENVAQLEVAWTYRTGDADTAGKSQIQCNPIVVNGVLYATSPRLRLLALDAATGLEQWVFEPGSPEDQGFNANRGVTYWEDGADHRILYVAGSVLYAVNAETGKLVESFADHGKLDLHTGLGDRSQKLFVTSTSPGVIYGDLFIIGTRVSEGADAASGDVRAFNIRTGELVWTFHTIPRPGEAGYDTWENGDAWKETGGANSWAGMSLDHKRGIVFVPTGSAGPDFYGAGRQGTNLFANCVLALDASTGKRLWHFQTIHHDLWDRDLPCPPSLVTVSRNGKKVEAVAQATKTGFVFLLDRETGEPLFPVEERPVPVTPALPGETPWPVQPVPVKPAPFVRQAFTEEDINPYVSAGEQNEIRDRLRQLDNSHWFSPPSLRGMIMFPGFDGGAEWGGTAFDPASGLFYVNSNEVPWTMTMVEKNAGRSAAGRQVYLAHCVSCHGADLHGGGDFPPLTGIDTLYSPETLLELIDRGNGRMPGFRHLPVEEKQALTGYLLGMPEESGATPGIAPDTNPGGTSGDRKEPGGPGAERFVMTGYKKMQTSEGYPAVSPPWGTLNAIDLNTGEYAWRVPLGTYPALTEKGIPVTGTENYGGAVVTAGGLVFIAATPDARIRAFDKTTGSLLWESRLPAPGFATPAVYQAGGRQYVVIACGGGKLGTPSGDSYVAFALPSP